MKRGEDAWYSFAAMLRMDCYRVLGVAREASDDDIKKAYRKLVFQHHPDRNPSSKDAEAKIREINAAYEVLGDFEQRRTYDRLQWGDEPREVGPSPTEILEEMETQLFDEGRKELFALVIKQVHRIKAELAIIRDRTVAFQGYDTFNKFIVDERAAEIMEEFVTPEMDARKKKLVDVAAEMLITRGVVKRGDEGSLRSLRRQLEDIFRRGRQIGFTAALELFYERR
ncbi:MAG TPA: DnaJ domain-containing protein [Nitrospiraceae bacterium]|nr:DnaJ domain-containing protein [Nitrospiraceae bacterium]